MTTGAAPNRPADGRVSAGGTPDASGPAGTATSRVPHDVRTTIVDEQLGAIDATDTIRRLCLMALAAGTSSIAAIVADHPVGWLLHAVVGGCVLTCALAAEHEALHGSMFRPPLANHVVGLVVGALCWTPYASYRQYHLRHHRRTHMEGDAEPAPVIRSRAALVATLAVGTLALVASTWIQVVGLLGATDSGSGAARRQRRLAAASLASSALFAAGIAWVWQTWGFRTVALVYLLPLAVHLVLSAATFLPEHYECRYGPAAVWGTTRTTVSTALMRFLLWNANLHTAHHLVPSVPCHSLPRLHELVQDRCEQLEPGYLRYYRGLWQRLGDRQLPPQPPWQR